MVGAREQSDAAAAVAVSVKRASASERREQGVSGTGNGSGSLSVTAAPWGESQATTSDEVGSEEREGYAGGGNRSKGR